jgi:nucleoside-diphosphate-sugar epimerase
VSPPDHPPLPADRRPEKVLVVGGGYTGSRFAAALAAQGVAVTVTHRTPPAVPAPFPWLPFDGGSGLLPEPEQLSGFRHVLITVPPGSDGLDPVLTQLAPRLQRDSLAWVGLLSTTGVYGDTGGAWVDEASPLAASLPRSQARVRSEAGWRALDLPLQIFRLPAIYGPGRSPFEGLLQGRSRMIHKQGQVFCRIHVDDIVGALLHCLALEPARRPEVLNLSDDEPCPSSETLGYAAHLIGARLPALEEYEAIAADLSPMARSFWSENRRVDNQRLCRELGYRLRHPTYREGYRACLEEEGRQPAA